MSDVTVTVETGIPVPRVRRRLRGVEPAGGGVRHVAMPAGPRWGHWNAKYPWRVLAVGESFVLPKNPANCYNHVRNAQRRTGYRYTLRTLTATSCRIWRIA